jgi:ATP-dependent Clp protease ATP-binding subunit ClpC
MELTIPIYIEVRREEGRPLHHVRPLFFGGVHASDAHLGLAMGKFNKRLKEVLDSLGREERHDGLAAAAFSPNLQPSLHKLTLDLRQRQAQCKLLFVSFAAFNRRIAFSPSLPDLWFDYWHEDRLEERATNVLSQFFREQGRDEKKGRNFLMPEDVSIPGQAWVSSVDLEVQTKPLDGKKLQRALAALFDEAHVDGDVELQRVGRCLDWLYPAELHQAVGRDREVTQLTDLLDGSDNRPIVLVGPRLAGKTAVLHECVRRRVARRGKPYAAKQNVWLLSPQRLISGMMYVGQWEGRLQAILKVAKKRRHVLYFDDFLGLYRAGISRDASLCAAEVIKPFIQRREVRVLAEMTPEAWQAFNERDRGLADQFQVIRIPAMSEEATRRVLLQVQRSLEREHGSRFDLAALPAILQLQQSYIRDAAFPGKAAGFARQLAKKLTKAAIGRREVYEEFHQKTGLALAILDEQRKLDRDQVLQDLQRRVIGQSAAVAAAADVVTVAKARLADRNHPLATLLFLGPTGVGKTQCAKALAEVMYTDPARLLRFDMNEYASPAAAAQLLGTADEPDGLLTSAVRRQPFSVVLLDEIEKAHPDVFDLLLQVTGEGRLTDSIGRTADFTNAVVVMTSNLGTAHSGRQIGLAASDATRQHVFVKAAESFFRPEFFNRIDRVIPFESLSREQMRQIAELLLEDVFRRDGLVRRRCALSVEPAAMERIVDAGYHPQFGARALKRAIEQQLMHPVAASLSGVKPELPAVVSVYPAAEGVLACVQPLESAQINDTRHFDNASIDEKLARIGQFLDRCEAELESAKPASSSGRGLSPEQIRYYALKEQLHQLRELKRALVDAVARASAPGARLETSPRQPGSTRGVGRMTTRVVSPRGVFRDIHAARDIHDYLKDAASGPRPETLAQQFLQWRYEAAYLHSLLTSVGDPEDAILFIHPLSAPARSWSAQLLALTQLFGNELSFSCKQLAVPDVQGNIALRLAGPGIWPLVQAEAGVHMFCRRQENLLPVQVAVFPLTPGEPLSQNVFAQRRSEWVARLAQGAATVAEDPWPLGPVLRFYDEGGPTVDVRSGLSLPTFPTAKEWRTLLLAGLPLPPELLSGASRQPGGSS